MRPLGCGHAGLHNAAMPTPFALLSVTLALLTPPLTLLAQEAQAGVRFQHKDWELACDNTGHCTAAGYQRDGDRHKAGWAHPAPCGAAA